MAFFIDLNCDLGESYFEKKIGNDREILPYITSCNIACGMHGGDPLTIQNTIDLALKHGVNIGAHPSYPDLDNFGRKPMSLSEEELKACLRFQIGAIREMTRLKGGKIRHVKPHGALYNAAADSFQVSKVIVDVIKEFDSSLILLGMANSEMEIVAKQFDVPFVSEVFADRNYTNNGKLVPRDHENSIVNSESQVLHRCLKMVKENIIISEDNKELSLSGKSICIHGDTDNALHLVKTLDSGFQINGIKIQSF